jgi:hypothetical protein
LGAVAGVGNPLLMISNTNEWWMRALRQEGIALRQEGNVYSMTWRDQLTPSGVKCNDVISGALNS